MARCLCVESPYQKYTQIPNLNVTYHIASWVSLETAHLARDKRQQNPGIHFNCLSIFESLIKQLQFWLVRAGSKGAQRGVSADNLNWTVTVYGLRSVLPSTLSCSTHNLSDYSWRNIYPVHKPLWSSPHSQLSAWAQNTIIGSYKQHIQLCIKQGVDGFYTGDDVESVWRSDKKNSPKK